MASHHLDDAHGAAGNRPSERTKARDGRAKFSSTSLEHRHTPRPLEIVALRPRPVTHRPIVEMPSRLSRAVQKGFSDDVVALIPGSRSSYNFS